MSCKTRVVRVLAVLAYGSSLGSTGRFKYLGKSTERPWTTARRALTKES